MRPPGGSRLRFLWPLALLAAAGCYEPPVRERVVLAIAADGTLRLSVETSFKQKQELTRKEREEIRRAVEDYQDGRDAWLAGFERAGAREVKHHLAGSEDAPESIVREGLIPSVESLEELMPDAIANFTLVQDDATRTLEMEHIDVPETLRRARRELGGEVGRFARALFRFSEAECDLYDHLGLHAERRFDVLQAVRDESRLEGALTPEETVLATRLNQAFEALMAYAAGAVEEGARDEPPLITRMSFSAFEHDFCVELPAEATALVGFVESNEEGKATHRYCTERLVTDDLMQRLWPRTAPPLFEEGVLENLLDDAAAREAAPFTCVRYDTPAAIASRIWEEILPRPLYEVSWSAPAAAP